MREKRREGKGKRRKDESGTYTSARGGDQMVDQTCDFG